MLFPYEFYHAREDVLRNKLELVDQFDHHFTISIKFAKKIVVMWEVVSQLKRYYDFEKIMYLHLKYEGGIRFTFENKDQEGVPLTPALVHPTGTSSVGEQGRVNVNSKNPNENPRGIVNRTTPQSSLIGRNAMRRVKVTLPHNVVVGRRVMSFQNQSGRVTVVAASCSCSDFNLNFHHPIPRKFVQDFIRSNWSELILKARGGQHYNCVMAPSSSKKGATKSNNQHSPKSTIKSRLRNRRTSTSNAPQGITTSSIKRHNHRDAIHEEFFGEAASISPDPHSSFVKELNMDEKVSKSSNNKEDTAQNQPQNNNDNEDMSIRVSQLGTSVEHLTNIVSGLTTILINHSPDIAAALKIVQGIPLSVNNTKTLITMDQFTPETVNQLGSADNQVNSKQPARNERNVEERLKKKLFTPNTNGSTSGMYMNLQPLHSADYDGRKIGVQIPWWFPMLFRPPEDLILDDIQATIGAYVFAANIDEQKYGNEVLVSTEKGFFGERWKMLCLRPKHYLSQDIFVPLNDYNNHWYLMVVDMRQQKLVLLDSFPTADRNDIRRREVKKMAVYLEEMLTHPSFYELRVTMKQRLTEFTLEVPQNIGRQAEESNDCGVWVCKWMIDCNWTTNYNIKVDKGARFKLAINLVNKEHNVKNEEILKVATNHWKKNPVRKNNMTRPSFAHWPFPSDVVVPLSLAGRCPSDIVAVVLHRQVVARDVRGRPSRSIRGHRCGFNSWLPLRLSFVTTVAAFVRARPGTPFVLVCRGFRLSSVRAQFAVRRCCVRLSFVVQSSIHTLTRLKLCDFGSAEVLVR
ncbi:Ulp1 protease family, C-terminal catalytic domain [Sesbania bispinosa]|nr:Ulp1 protease family, C-terminal catalytic domain [Sesbania bispinosa]